jgi:uncharacterized protein
MERPTSEKSIEIDSNLWLRDGELRVVWKLLAFAGVFLLTAFVLFAVALTLGLHGRLSFLLLQMVAVTAATLFCMAVIERESFLHIGLRMDSSAIRAALAGVGLASVMLTLVFVVELTTGIARTTFLPLDAGKAASILASGLLFFSIVAIEEEMIARGYPFLVLQRRYSNVVAILLTAIVFSLMHAGNPSVTVFALINIFLAGVWFGVARVLSATLWLPIGLHLAWNFMLGTVYGYPVSGIIGESVLKTDTAGPEWITGGYFGPEGGILVTVVLAVGTLALFHPAVHRCCHPTGCETQTIEKHEVAE